MSDPNFLYVQPEEINVAEWCPTPDGSGKPTQVHLLMGRADAGIVIRFKSPRTLDQLIAALQTHREGVWGKP